jgi:hypothetical protein
MSAGAPKPAWPYVWRLRCVFPRDWMGDRKGQPCRVLVRSRRMNSALVEFADGFRVVTTRNAIRKAA